ncbi:MAG: hypothetical protein H0U71_09570 [Gammaproteobacteria bacterium]|nr:hypothetical protein [Gammaproteobacteria bacterium]
MPINKPDYEFLLKLDSWSQKNACLIICGLDPDKYRSIRFTVKDHKTNIETYPELINPYKLHQIFTSVHFYKYREHRGHPAAYLNECVQKKWPIPEELWQLAKEAYANQFPELFGSKADETKIEQVKSKEEEYLSKTLGAVVMAYVFKNKSPRLGSVKSINIFQVTEDILQFLEDHNLKIYGLGKSSIQRRIAESLRTIQRDIHLVPDDQE